MTTTPIRAARQVLARRGACRRSELDFVPEPWQLDLVVAAQRVCRTCSVQELCLRLALDAPERYGVWGGTTEAERAVLRRAGREGVA